METKSPVLVGYQLNVLRGVSFSVSDVPKLRLGTTLPNAVGAIAEVALGGYLPYDLPSNEMYAADHGKIRNATQLIFPVATASYMVQSWQITVGTEVFYAGHLRSGETVEIGDYFFFDTDLDKCFQIDEANGGGLPQCASIALRNRRLNAVFKGQPLTPQASITVRLTKTKPNPLTGEAELLSPNAEKDYPCSTAGWTDPGLTREMTTLLPIQFDQFTADTGPIGGYQILSEGELWYWGELAPGKYGWNRDLLTIEPGGIILRG